MLHRNKGPNHYKPVSKQNTSNLNTIVSIPTTPLGKRTPSCTQGVCWDKYVFLESSEVLYVTETVHYSVSQGCNIAGLFMACRSTMTLETQIYFIILLVFLRVTCC